MNRSALFLCLGVLAVTAACSKQNSTEPQAAPPADTSTMAPPAASPDATTPPADSSMTPPAGSATPDSSTTPPPAPNQ